MKDKTKLIAVRLSPLELAKLDALAKEKGVNRTGKGKGRQPLRDATDNP